MNRMLILLGLLWAGSLVLSAVPTRMVYGRFALFLVFGLHFAAKVLIASESGRRFHLDRQSGVLELLLATPLRVEDIVAGQREALRRQFQWAVWAISLANIVTLIFVMIVESSRSSYVRLDEYISMLEVFLGGAVMLWLDASALSWIGMWRGLKARKYPRSVLSTWAHVMLPPWLVFSLFVFVGPVLHSGTSESTMIFFVLLWFGLGAAIDLAGIAWAREKLFTSFRATVSARADG
jgi:hypothetical protein